MDREKVIKGLECMDKQGQNGIPCSECPYDNCEFVCGYVIVHDALELLKEQEAKWIHREDMDFIDKYNCTHFHGMCTNCGLVHDFIDGHTGQYLYCPQCGRSVKWE